MLQDSAQVVSALPVWSIIASVVSVILGFVAIALALVFYLTGRKTESRVSNSLTKIETQTDALQKITGRQLDRLTKFATERPKKDDAALDRFAKVFTDFSESIKNSLQEPPSVKLSPEAEALITRMYILLHFYTAQLNIFAELLLPSRVEFDPGSDYHNAVMRAVDGSADDYRFCDEILANTSEESIRASVFYEIYLETKSNWGTTILTSQESFRQED
ncbi:MAG: hypothetical protein O7H41_01410 [Planctomycetota bacterium]|nr:hypothetical protein [Planctomycetota bacterium]